MSRWSYKFSYHQDRSHPSPQNGMDESLIAQYRSGVQELDRDAHDSGHPSHYGTDEKQLHSRTGFNLAVNKQGFVYGTTRPNNEDAILQIHSRGDGEVQIKGKRTKLYIAMNPKGRVYSESDTESKNTWFKEIYEDGWNSYKWLGNKKDWYIGIRVNGTLKNGHSTLQGTKPVQFLPRV